MRRLNVGHLALVASLVAPAGAFAQDESATNAPASAPVQPHAAATPTGTACVVGDHVGIDDADAATATSMVCQELQEQGVVLRASTPTDENPAASTYRVHFRKLGSLLVLQLVYESPTGVQLKAKQIRLGKIEDTVVGAQRLADAIIHDKRVEDTAQIDNLTHEETRKYTQIDTRTEFGAGLVGVLAFGNDVRPGYGAEIFLMHSGPRLGGKLFGRLAGGKASLAALGVSGRYYLTETNVAPYVDLGLEILGLGIDSTHGNLGDYEGGGFAAVAEFGLELMRFQTSRIGFAVRADIPFYALDADNYDTNKTKTSYFLPVGFSAYYVF